MPRTRRPRVSQISWPVPISVAIAAKRSGKASILDVADRLGQRFEQAAAADQAKAAEAHVKIAEQPAPREAARPRLDLVELAGRIAAADHRADRGAGNDVGLEALRDEGADTPMCAKPRAAPPPSASAMVGRFATVSSVMSTTVRSPPDPPLRRK